MAISRALIEALMNGEVGATGGDSMLSAYQANPFYMQDNINNDSLDRSLAESLKNKNNLAMSGQFVDSGGSETMPLDPSVEAFLDAENSTERGARIQQDLPELINNTLLMGVVPSMFGLIDSASTTSPGALAAQANIYGRTPGFLQSMLPQSYANASGFINQNDSIFGGYNPNGQVSMGAQQSAALAAQDMGLFDSAAERGSFYSNEGNVASGGQDGFGGQNDSTMTGYTE